MVCEYTYKDGVIKVSCVGCIFGSSHEDYGECFARTVDKLMETKGADSVILSQNREREYDKAQTEMVLEVANALRAIIENGYLDFRNFPRQECLPVLAKRYASLRRIVIEDLRHDPIGAYVEISREIRHARIAEGGGGTLRECGIVFAENVLEPIKALLEGMRLVQLARSKGIISGYKVGDRSFYRDVFHPVVKPNFMYTKYVAQPPLNGKIISKYTLPNGIRIEIYEVAGRARKLYYALPPEFSLSEEKYVILDAARRYIAAHSPKESEFAQPEKMRGVFQNILFDLINDIASHMNAYLSRDEAEELTQILTRYTVGLGALEILLADEKVQDIFVNSPVGQRPAEIRHADFDECETNLIPTLDDANTWATRFKIMSGRPLDEANPVLDTEMATPGGRARVSVIQRTLSPEGLGFAIRRHRDRPWTYPLFVDKRYIDTLFSGLMSFIIDGGRSFLVAGTRGAGKTSFLGATMLEIMRKTRIVTVEDTLELPVSQMRELGFNIERMKSRSVITRVETELPAEEAIRAALRLGDSALILGEVRSTEAKALYEAMRVGALANAVAGTIHGDSPYGVFDRVVNDLGVPATSFKATDFIVVCNMFKTADGLHSFRRVAGITEVRKHWKDDPQNEGGFVPLMEYSARDDTLKPTETFLNGESEILNQIADSIKEFSGRWEAVWENIVLRGRLKETIIAYASKYSLPELMEAPFVVKSNNAYHLISASLRREVGAIPSDRTFALWEEWAKKEIKGMMV